MPKIKTRRGAAKRFKKTASGKISGIPSGLDDDCSLIVRLDSGIQSKISSGDLIIN